MKIFITVLLFIVISPAFALKVAVISDMNSSYGSSKYNSAVDITDKIEDLKDIIANKKSKNQKAIQDLTSMMTRLINIHSKVLRDTT